MLRAQPFLCALLIALLSACGAKTGLYTPDAETNASLDAGVDAAVDAGDAGPDADIPCVEVPLDGGPVNVDLAVEAEIGRADVVFLIDTTASMGDEIMRIRERLRDRLAPAIEEAVPDSQIAVAHFRDFPITPYGNSAEDVPFKMVLPATDDVAQVQAAVNSLELGDGRDAPESHVEALFQLATGVGGPFVDPNTGCPGGGIGYACARRDALPVVLLFTDAEMHNGPGGANAYDSPLLAEAAVYGQAVDALNSIGARVIGFDSGSDQGSRDHLRAVAEDTGTLDGSGRPLVFDIGPTGERLTNQVVSAIRTFASTIVFDVDTVLEDVDRTDAIDVRDLVEAVVPVRAEPADGVREIDPDAGAFLGVVAGTRIVFEIIVDNDVVEPGPEPQRFLLGIVFRGDGRTRLDREVVEIVVPSADGLGCGDGGDVAP